MINRRSMLKLIGLAPVAAPAIAAPIGAGLLPAPVSALDQAAFAFQFPADYVADLSEYKWVRHFDLETGETISFLQPVNSATAMAQFTSTPVNEEMRAYCDEPVPAPSAYTVIAVPYHPELTIHA